MQDKNPKWKKKKNQIEVSKQELKMLGKSFFQRKQQLSVKTRHFSKQCLQVSVWEAPNHCGLILQIND